MPPASGVEPLEEPPLDEPLEEPLDDPLDDPLEEPLDPPEDDPLEDAPPELPLLEPPLLLPPLEPPLLEPLLPPPGGVSGVEVVAGPPEHPVIATKATAIGASGILTPRGRSWCRMKVKSLRTTGTAQGNEPPEATAARAAPQLFGAPALIQSSISA